MGLPGLDTLVTLLEPAVNLIIERAIVKFESVDIKNLNEDGFDLDLKVLLTDTGPFPATITFNNLEVFWSDSESEFQIATIQLSSSVSVNPLQGGLLQAPATLKITKPTVFTQFLGKVLLDASFDWRVHSPNLGVSSLNIPFDKIAFSKPITLNAFAGLPGISLQRFELLPADTEDDPSIKIKADVTVVSKSQLSILIGKVCFYFSLGDSIIGEVSAENLHFPANHDGKTIIPFLGQTVKPDLGAVGILISKFLNGKQQTLKIQAKSVHPPVFWLTQALREQTLYALLDSERCQVINDIECLGVSIMEDQNQQQHISSTCTIIKYINPFGFSFQIIQVDVAATLGYQGVDEVATLDLNSMPVKPVIESESMKNPKPGTPEEVQVEFRNETLNILALEKFKAWRDNVKSSPNTPIELHGTAKVVVQTPIGLVTITDLPFNFPSYKFNDIKWL